MDGLYSRGTDREIGKHIISKPRTSRIALRDPPLLTTLNWTTALWAFALIKHSLHVHSSIAWPEVSPSNRFPTHMTGSFHLHIR